MFFPCTALFWCADFIVRTKFEQLKKEGSRFIFYILFLSDKITTPTFLFSDKNKIMFPRPGLFPLLSFPRQGLFPVLKIPVIVQFTKKGLN